MVDREVEWPVWVVLGRSWGFCVRSWAALGAYVGGLGAVLGPMLAILSCSWGLCVGSWAALGANVRGPRPSWDLCWRSSAALGAYVVGPGPLLGPMLAVLGRSWGLSWRSWPLLGPPKAVLGRDQGRKAVQTRKSGPNPSGKAIWAGDRNRTFSDPPGPLRIFSHIYIYIYIYTHKSSTCPYTGTDLVRT